VDGVSPNVATAKVTINGPVGGEKGPKGLRVRLTTTIPLGGCSNSTTKATKAAASSGITCPPQADVDAIAQAYLTLLRGQPGVTAATLVKAADCTWIVSGGRTCCLHRWPYYAAK
jgi:hypothetical protein